MSSKYLEWQQQDYYAIMGVTRMADTEEIRKAFRLRAKECHPDRFPPDSPEREEAAEYFKKLILARDTLLDTAKREAYDREQDFVQQAYFDSVVFEVPAPEFTPSKKGVPPFIESLKQAYSAVQHKDFYSKVDYTVGGDSDADDEDEERPRGIPESSRKNAAGFYYAQGMRYAARGQYRRALYAFNNAKMLDPGLYIPEHLMTKIRNQAYYS